MLTTQVRGESHFLCNSHWSNFFLPEDACNRFFLKSGALPYDTFALYVPVLSSCIPSSSHVSHIHVSAGRRGVSPEDREEFFQACSRLLFSAHGDTADMSKIVKASQSPSMPFPF